MCLPTWHRNTCIRVPIILEFYDTGSKGSTVVPRSYTTPNYAIFTAKPKLFDPTIPE